MMSLDLNYQPKALVDTATLTEDEWLAWRKKGIGGSDVAAAPACRKTRHMRQAYAGFLAYIGQRRIRANGASFSFHNQQASFFRFMAANLSFTQLDTWAKPLYWV